MFDKFTTDGTDGWEAVSRIEGNPTVDTDAIDMVIIWRGGSEWGELSEVPGILGHEQEIGGRRIERERRGTEDLEEEDEEGGNGGHFGRRTSSVSLVLVMWVVGWD